LPDYAERNDADDAGDARSSSDADGSDEPPDLNADDAGYTDDADGAVPLPQRGGAGYGLYDDDVYDLLFLPRFFSSLDLMHYPVR